VRVDLHPEAQAEFRSAAIWYDERQPGLGDTFIAEVNLTLDRITESPRLFPPWPGVVSRQSPIRRAVTDTFPYVLAFEELPNPDAETREHVNQRVGAEEIEPAAAQIADAGLG
jgi:hypothetical protein